MAVSENQFIFLLPNEIVLLDRLIKHSQLKRNHCVRIRVRVLIRLNTSSQTNVLSVFILPQNALRRDCNCKWIE